MESVVYSMIAFFSLILFIPEGYCGITPTVSILLFRPEDGRTDIGDIYVNLKDDLIIECQIDNMPPETKVQWYFESDYATTPTMISLDMLSYNPNKYKIAVGQEMNSFRLTVKSMEVKDTGKYECKVHYAPQTDPLTDSVRVVVGEKPIIQMSMSSTDKTTKQGDTVELSCYARGSPEPRIIWKRGGGAQLPGGGETVEGNTLRLENVQPDARGYYICEAINERGLATMKIQLYVDFRPIINVDNAVEYQAPGYVKGLTCIVEANPQPKHSAVVWSKDGVLIKPDERHSIDFNLASDYQVISSMVIKGVRPTDYGLYTCLASNREGQGSAQIKLEESDQGRPDGKTGQIIAAATQTSVSFLLVIVSIVLTLRFNLQ
ncbi:protein amalgam-like [Tubulanus polymorphus]|uniref:protein amalgam-like n=1 Tax=Tubulanus polymorphus TaxID=672921 RepID=UPI003DA4C3D4